MSLLGFHLALTLISASILQKLSAKFSFGRRLLSNGLRRWLPPHQEELKELLGHVPQKGKKRKNKDVPNADSFWLPKSLPVQIYDHPVISRDVLQLPNYVDYRWLCDFTLCASIVYALTEVYLFLTSGAYTNEVNLSLIWCSITIALALKSLASMTALYFGNTERSTEERSLVLCIGAGYFLGTFVFQLWAERIYDVQFHAAYENFTSTANQFLKEQDMDVKRSSKTSVLLYVFFSVLFGFIAGMLVFPCLRFAKIYADSLRAPENGILTRLIIHLNFFAPIFTLVLWIKPFSVALVSRDPQIITMAQLEALRVWSVVAVMLLRLLALRPSMQAYLNVAYDKLQRLRTQSGRIKSDELQAMVTQVYIFTGVVATQYIAPAVLLFAVNLMLKTLGGYSWLTPFGVPELRLPWLMSLSSKEAVMFGSASNDLRQSLLQLSALFNTVVNRGVLSFLLVMLTTIVVSLNLIGVVYNIRFEN